MKPKDPNEHPNLVMTALYMVAPPRARQDDRDAPKPPIVARYMVRPPSKPKTAPVGLEGPKVNINGEVLTPAEAAALKIAVQSTLERFGKANKGDLERLVAVELESVLAKMR